MKKDDMLVIDAVGHAIDFSDDNRFESAPKEAIADFDHYAFSTFMGHLESREPGYRLEEEQFISRWTAEDLAHAFFVESDVDMVAMHSVLILSLIHI